MRITQKQQRAILSLFTARTWPARISAIIVLALAAFTWWSQSQVSPGQLTKGSQIEGRVVGVADGDTITILDADKKQYKLRLAYIDAPEKAMPFGQAAKSNLSDLVFEQQVTAHIDDVDRYGRGVARISKAEQDINLAQINAGLAWHYTTYAKKAQNRTSFQQYEAAQSKAQTQRSGLWQDSNPTPPWDWRKANR
ncbi:MULTISPECIES: thermonuclease family protein [Deefgea]|uniref:Nuclease n=1 Tax=Deefgea chitinilytica TaxID=570276 RepID=A0ABS2CB25_9NEIS|nr:MULTISPECIES: thermonuclease family protein [Deefgea]MBM5571351.1 nuclease [Deefgea chitinilytica]MBM9888584.1 thermonuclease family protein [Deefgea sp. CFH1-16]